MSSWKRAFVTGAGGFIGSHLVEALVRRGVEVRAFLRYTSQATRGNLVHVEAAVLQEVDLVYGNLEDPFAVGASAHGCDVIFHLGALIGIPYSYRAPQQYVMANVVGTQNVLEAGRAAGVDRIVCVSTSEVYGTARYTPIDEAHPLQGQSPYAASKIAAEKLAESYARSFGVPVTIVRPFNTYGPRQSTRAVIPTIISQMLRCEEIRLGALSPVRDFNFVADTVEGLLAAAAANTEPGAVFNLGSGVAVAIGEVVERCQRLTGLRRRVVCDEQRLRPQRSEVLELRCDGTRAYETFGWRPAWSLDDGLRATIEWIEAHGELFRPSEYAT